MEAMSSLLGNEFESCSNSETVLSVELGKTNAISCKEKSQYYKRQKGTQASLGAMAKATLELTPTEWGFLKSKVLLSHTTGLHSYKTVHSCNVCHAEQGVLFTTC